MANAGIVCVCAALTLSVKAVPVAESFADVAKVPVEFVLPAVVEPVVPAVSYTHLTLPTNREV